MKAVALAMLLCLPVLAAEKKPKTPKPPDLTVLDLTARRNENVIELEGHLRNSGEKPLAGVTLVFRFYASGHSLISSKRTKIDEDILDQNAEATINAQTNSPPRAIEIDVSAVDEKGRDLNVSKPGPYPIE